MKEDPEVTRLRSHNDQTRCQVRDILHAMSGEELVHLVKTGASGRLSDLDEPMQLLIGMLATVAIFDLMETTEEEV